MVGWLGKKQTNSTRAKTLELHIAQRVADELEKIEKRETEALNGLRRRIAEEASRNQESDPSSSQQQSGDKPKTVKQRVQSLLELPSVSAADLLPTVPSAAKEPSEEEKRKSQSSAQVQAEIERLRKQLGERKQLRELPKEVEQARERVVGCLRLNDRKPLDCWKEVETFKREVRRMEERFVGGVL